MSTKPGSIYEGADGRKYLAVYGYSEDVRMMLTPDFRTAERVGAVSYLRGGRTGSIDLFLLNPNLPSVSSIINLKKNFSYVEEGIKVSKKEESGHWTTHRLKIGNPNALDVAYDIKSQVVSSFPEEVRREVLDFARSDVYFFCGEKVAQNPTGPRNDLVSRIMPITKLERITPQKVLTGGKAEFIPQCFLEANIDYMKGCITSCFAGPEASFDGEYFRDYWQFIWGDCDYCYAEKDHKNFFKSFYEFDKQRLLEDLRGGAKLKFGSEEPWGKPIEILRFGKRTDPWTPFTETEFLETLDAMTETKTHGIITTKFLPYDKRFVELFKKTKSTVLFSTGGSEAVELGPVAWGRTNDFRIEQARLYREQKVNSALFYIMNPVFPPTKDDLRRLAVAEKNRIPVQFIPARFYNKEAAQSVIAPLAGLEGTGLSAWDILRDDHPGQQDFAPNYWFANSYEIAPGTQLVPKLDRMHPFWKAKVAENTGGQFRMCAHDGDNTYCGGCFARPGSISPTEEMHEFVKLTRRVPTGEKDMEALRLIQEQNKGKGNSRQAPRPDPDQVGMDLKQPKSKK